MPTLQKALDAAYMLGNSAIARADDKEERAELRALAVTVTKYLESLKTVRKTK